MMTAAEEPAENVTEPPVKGPGERLRAARIAAGLEKERVATQLHLSPGQIDELERDHYDGFAARVFVRGYLRNYARLVELPVDGILAAFDAVWPDPDEPELKSVGSEKPQVSSRHGGVRLVSWLLLLGILALFGVWWSGYLELNGKTESALPSLNDSTATSESPVLPLAEGSGEIGLALPPRPSEPATSEPERVESPEQEAVPAALPSAPTVPEVTSFAPQSAAETGGEKMAAAEIVLTLDAPCWVNIRDSSNSFRLIGEFEAGTRRVLGGTPPYKVLLGNAAAATLSIDGEPFDLKPHTRKQVARFILDPASR